MQRDMLGLRRDVHVDVLDGFITAPSADNQADANIRAYDDRIKQRALEVIAQEIATYSSLLAEYNEVVN